MFGVRVRAALALCAVVLSPSCQAEIAVEYAVNPSQHFLL